MHRFSLLIWLTLALTAVSLLMAQDHGSITGNPFSTPDDEKKGADSFRSQCAACHGLHGEGGSNGPSLTTGTFSHGGTDEGLFRTITKGVPGTAMVAFPLSGRDVWQLIAFIRSVNRGVVAEKAPGNAAEGERIYQSSGCARCHTVAGSGGFTGPDLSGIALRKTLAQLQDSLTNPDADVSPDYWSLRARTKTGQAVSGIRMNEDMDSFQIRDSSGKLRSFRKADLTNYQIVHTSPMPSFKDKLTSEQLQNVVAYLATLRGEPEVH